MFSPLLSIANNATSLNTQYQKSLKLLDSNPLEAVTISQKVYEKAVSASDNELAWKAAYNLGYLYHKKLNNEEQGLLYYLSAMGYCPDTQQKKTGIINNIARILEKHSNFDKAIEFYTNALQIADDTNKGMVYLNRGNAYKKQGDLENAIKDYLSGLAYSEKTGNTIRKFKLHNQIGLVFHHSRSYKKAREHFHEIINYTEIENYPKYAGRALHNLANTFLKQKDYTRSIDFFKEALAVKENEAEKFITHMDLGYVYHLSGNSTSAMVSYKRAEQLFSLQDPIKENYQVFKLMSTTAYNIGDIEQSLSYKDQYILLSDSFADQKDKISIALDGDQVESILNNYYVEVAANEVNNELKKYTMYIMVGSLVLILGIVIFFSWSAYAKKRLVNQIIEE